MSMRTALPSQRHVLQEDSKMYPDRQLANYVCQAVTGCQIKTKPHVRYVLQGMLNHQMKARCAYRAKKEDTSLKMAPKRVKSARREDSPPSHPCAPAQIVLKVAIYIARARRHALIVRAEAIRFAQLPRDAYPATQAPFRMHHRSRNCMPCAAGKRSPKSGSTSCFECAPGFASQEGAAVCKECPAGTFSARHGLSYCTSCMPGRYAAKGQRECSVREINNTIVPPRLVSIIPQETGQYPNKSASIHVRFSASSECQRTLILWKVANADDDYKAVKSAERNLL